ncbi:MAG: HAMP domain-containing histidine kinase [Anaerolineales bacterium]|nr:HAMP domain-containing histidine kinase [Anaerolineales bacterium]
MITVRGIRDKFQAYSKVLNIGSGLGLSIVGSIMQAHGGSVTISSDIGRGARFKLIFPRSKES